MADQANTTEDIVASTGTQKTEGTNTQTNDVLGELVGEGKKFRDIAALAAGKVESDKFIEQLKREAAELRAELSKTTEQAATQHTLTEVLAALNQRPPNDNDATDQGTAPKPVSLEDIARLVKATNAAEKSAEAAKTNRMSVNKKLLELAGGNPDTARELLATRSTELGLTSDQVRDMSEKSPAALIELIAGKQANSGTTNTTVPRSRVNSEALITNQGNTGERKLSYYTAKRKEMGVNKYYNDHAIQAQYQADLRKHGAGFIDT